jgi:hypothetical protein
LNVLYNSLNNCFNYKDISATACSPEIIGGGAGSVIKFVLKNADEFVFICG